MRPIWPAFALVAAGCGNPGISPKAGVGGHGLAVVAGDGQATALALVDGQTSQLASADCAGALALSGDVVLPTVGPSDGRLLLIDRAQAQLDYLGPGGCQLAARIAVDTGFAAAPHDVVTLAADKAYVTRFASNPAPSAAAGAFDGGNDLLVVDPATATIRGRIDLSTYASNAAVAARPDRAIWAHGMVYVTLTNLGLDGKSYGPGRLVLIDPTSDAVAGTLDLPAFKRCSGLDYLPASHTLVVGCGGDPSDTAINQVAQSALVLVNISNATAPAIFRSIGGSATGNRPLSPAAFCVTGDDFALAVSVGDGEAGGGTADSLWRLQLDSAGATHVLDGAAAGVFGDLVWNAAARRAYLTDAAAAAATVRVLDVSNEADIEPRASFAVDPARGLPPRAMGWY